MQPLNASFSTLVKDIQEVKTGKVSIDLQLKLEILVDECLGEKGEIKDREQLSKLFYAIEAVKMGVSELSPEQTKKTEEQFRLLIKKSQRTEHGWVLRDCLFRSIKNLFSYSLSEGSRTYYQKYGSQFYTEEGADRFLHSYNIWQAAGCAEYLPSKELQDEFALQMGLISLSTCFPHRPESYECPLTKKDYYKKTSVENALKAANVHAGILFDKDNCLIWHPQETVTALQGAREEFQRRYPGLPRDVMAFALRQKFWRPLLVIFHQKTDGKTKANHIQALVSQLPGQPHCNYGKWEATYRPLYLSGLQRIFADSEIVTHVSKSILKALDDVPFMGNERSFAKTLGNVLGLSEEEIASSVDQATAFSKGNSKRFQELLVQGLLTRAGRYPDLTEKLDESGCSLMTKYHVLPDTIQIAANRILDLFDEKNVSHALEPVRSKEEVEQKDEEIDNSKGEKKAELDENLVIGSLENILDYFEKMVAEFNDKQKNVPLAILPIDLYEMVKGELEAKFEEKGLELALPSLTVARSPKRTGKSVDLQAALLEEKESVKKALVRAFKEACKGRKVEAAKVVRVLEEIQSDPTLSSEKIQEDLSKLHLKNLREANWYEEQEKGDRLSINFGQGFRGQLWNEKAFTKMREQETMEKKGVLARMFGIGSKKEEGETVDFTELYDKLRSEINLAEAELFKKDLSQALKNKNISLEVYEQFIRSMQTDWKLIGTDIQCNKAILNEKRRKKLLEEAEKLSHLKESLESELQIFQQRLAKDVKEKRGVAAPERIHHRYKEFFALKDKAWDSLDANQREDWEKQKDKIVADAYLQQELERLNTAGKQKVQGSEIESEILEILDYGSRDDLALREKRYQSQLAQLQMIKRMLEEEGLEISTLEDVQKKIKDVLYEARLEANGIPKHLLSKVKILIQCWEMEIKKMEKIIEESGARTFFDGIPNDFKFKGFFLDIKNRIIDQFLATRTKSLVGDRLLGRILAKRRAEGEKIEYNQLLVAWLEKTSESEITDVIGKLGQYGVKKLPDLIKINEQAYVDKVQFFTKWASRIVIPFTQGVPLINEDGTIESRIEADSSILLEGACIGTATGWAVASQRYHDMPLQEAIQMQHEVKRQVGRLQRFRQAAHILAGKFGSFTKKSEEGKMAEREFPLSTRRELNIEDPLLIDRKIRLKNGEVANQICDSLNMKANILSKNSQGVAVLMFGKIPITSKESGWGHATFIRYQMPKAAEKENKIQKTKVTLAKLMQGKKGMTPEDAVFVVGDPNVGIAALDSKEEFSQFLQELFELMYPDANEFGLWQLKLKTPQKK